MHAIQGLLSVVARFMIAAIFLASAVMNKIPQFNAVAEVMASKGIPQPKIMLAGAIAFLLLGSVSLILGYYARFGALLLLVFLAAATYHFHAFWKIEPGETQMTEQINFMKNVALMGAMVLIIANGSGPWSLDGRVRNASETEAADAATGITPRPVTREP